MSWKQLCSCWTMPLNMAQMSSGVHEAVNEQMDEKRAGCHVTVPVRCWKK